MDYNDIRDSIVTGDLYFSASSHLFSRFIRFFTQSKVSHVGVFVCIGSRIFIIEALEGKGVIMSLASERVKETTCWYARTSRQTNSINKIEDILLSELGNKYDMIGALLSLFIDTRTSKKFCSELAQKALGIKLPFSKRGTTPSDIVNLCETIIPLKN